jgi:hypothetical protein
MRSGHTRRPREPGIVAGKLRIIGGWALKKPTWWDSTVWSSKTWAAGNWVGYSGPGWHDVFVREAGETVAVFGVTSSAVYVETFKSETGENRCRFSTAYFDRSSPREQLR